MSVDRVRRSEELFNQAVELEGADRRRFLDEACAGDGELRRVVDLLLLHDDAVDPAFLEGESLVASERLAHDGAIGPYRIVRELGRGGQGVVYLAEDTRILRQVALKVLRRTGTLSREAVGRFRREAEAASRLDHPGICTVYEAALDGDVPYIAMRYVEGESLAAKIGKSRASDALEHTCISLPELVTGGDAPAEGARVPPATTTPAEVLHAVLLIENVARAIHAAHEVGVIHRDLKPGNIMVTPPGDPVVMDFGLADLEGAEQEALTRTGEIYGTPAYMSPEQLLAQRVRLDRRTDVWSLGVTLYECLTLTKPFEAPTREGLYHAIQTVSAPDAKKLNPAVPDDLRVVLETAIEKDRDRRYQTALDLAEELRRVRMHEPIVAKPVGPLGRLERWAQRNPALATAVGGLFAVLVIGLAVALFLLGQRDRALAEVTAERNDKETARSSLAASVADYDRLGDLSRLQRLRVEADELWPCEPSKVAAMTAWLEQGASLAQRLPGHRELLDRLRTSSGVRQYTAADRAADLAAHAADHERLESARRQIDDLRPLAAGESRPTPTSAPASRVVSRVPMSSVTSRPSSPDEIRAALAKLDAAVARLDSKIHERLTWKFASTAEQFKHDTTAKLVADLTAFVNPNRHEGLAADMRARLAFAESVERETISKYEDAWKRAVDSIAANPKYHGLIIKPQLGLIPIDQDPKSGLWEFVHLQTAASGRDPIPKRDASGKLIVTEDMGIVFVLLPGGTFAMGAAKPDEGQSPTLPNVDPEAFADESPVTQVTLDPFFLSKYEMTQGQWLRVVGKNPSDYGPGTDFGGKVVNLRHPVDGVSWEECDRWLGRFGLIIPTEAQWEYGARAGTTTPRWTGIGTDGLSKAANLADEFYRQHGGSSVSKYESWNDGYVVQAPVGSFAANAFGLHDVLGNMSEWCRDRYDGYDAPVGKGDGLRNASPFRDRVCRGAGFCLAASLARSSFRINLPPELHDSLLGVRPARPCHHD